LIYFHILVWYLLIYSYLSLIPVDISSYLRVIYLLRCQLETLCQYFSLGCRQISLLFKPSLQLIYLSLREENSGLTLGLVLEEPSSGLLGTKATPSQRRGLLRRRWSIKWHDVGVGGAWVQFGRLGRCEYTMNSITKISKIISKIVPQIKSITNNITKNITHNIAKNITNDTTNYITNNIRNNITKNISKNQITNNITNNFINNITNYITKNITNIITNIIKTLAL